jgi:hypothetical protein
MHRLDVAYSDLAHVTVAVRKSVHIRVEDLDKRTGLDKLADRGSSRCCILCPMLSKERSSRNFVAVALRVIVCILCICSQDYIISASGVKYVRHRIAASCLRAETTDEPTNYENLRFTVWKYGNVFVLITYDVVFALFGYISVFRAGIGRMFPVMHPLWCFGIKH